VKKIANIFKALSDETRLRVMKLLQERELCVCELMQVLSMSQPRISRHLSVLKNAGLVDDRRDGKWVYYSLCNGVENKEIKTILKSLSETGNEMGVVKEDKKKLKNAVRLSELKGACHCR
jgi:DNA-binding transcriptional ArsR family regulator